MKKGWKRVHRLVVLPDYQGIGIGTAFIEEIAKMYVANGYVFNLTTTTPSLIYGLAKNPYWILKRQGRDMSGKNAKKRFKKNWQHLTKSLSTNRITFSFYYENDELGNVAIKEDLKSEKKAEKEAPQQLNLFDI